MSSLLSHAGVGAKQKEELTPWGDKIFENSQLALLSLTEENERKTKKPQLITPLQSEHSKGNKQ